MKLSGEESVDPAQFNKDYSKLQVLKLSHMSVTSGCAPRGPMGT